MTSINQTRIATINNRIFIRTSTWKGSIINCVWSCVLLIRSTKKEGRTSYSAVQHVLFAWENSVERGSPSTTWKTGKLSICHVLSDYWTYSKSKSINPSFSLSFFFSGTCPFFTSHIPIFALPLNQWTIRTFYSSLGRPVELWTARLRAATNKPFDHMKQVWQYRKKSEL